MVSETLTRRGSNVRPVPRDDLTQGWECSGPMRRVGVGPEKVPRGTIYHPTVFWLPRTFEAGDKGKAKCSVRTLKLNPKSLQFWGEASSWEKPGMMPEWPDVALAGLCLQSY